MKSLIKKNQLMITALAIMIAIAGYLQFAGTDLEKEYLNVNDDNVYTEDSSLTGGQDIVTQHYTTEDLLDLSAEDLLQEGVTQIDSMDSDYEDTPIDNFLDADIDVISQNGTIADAEISGEVEIPKEGEIPGEAVLTSNNAVAILSEAKLLKEQTRAKNKETLLQIINSAELSEKQKQQAVDSMVKMTEIAERESAAEILLEAKGFEGVVVSMNESGVDVVVNDANLDDVKRAQIEDIVTRKTNVSAKDIVISSVVH